MEFDSYPSLSAVLDLSRIKESYTGKKRYFHTLFVDLQLVKPIELEIKTAVKAALHTEVEKPLLCPGFSWDGVDSPPSNLPSAVLCTQCENHVENTLMFWLLLSSVFPESETSKCLMLCQGLQENLGGITAGTGDLNESKGYSNIIKCHDQHINWFKW